MTELPDVQEPRPATTPPRVLILDVHGPLADPEDGITLLERWANLDPPNSPRVSAITKTATAVQLPFLLG
jgi:hypothetical protein